MKDMEPTPVTPAEPSTAPTPAAPEKQGRCIVVFGNKGGVGKTVVAANLAVGLAQLTKKPVCLIDLDLLAMGDLAKMLGLSPQRSLVDLVPAVKRQTPVERLPFDEMALPHSSGVHLIQALMNPRHTNAVDPASLTTILTALKARYDYVVIDGGKAFTDQLIAAFDTCNLILLVATPDIVALYQTKWALGMIESLLFPGSLVKAVINRAESRGGVGSKDIRVAMPCEVVGEIPSDGKSMGTAINEGTPVLLLFGYSKVAEAFRQLAQRLATSPDLYVSHKEIPRHQRTEASADTAAPVSFTTRLFASPDAVDLLAEQEDEIVRLKRRVHAQLVEELNLKTADLALMGGNPTQLRDLREQCERVIANLVARELGGIVSSHEVRARLVKEIADEALGLGPLEELLADATVTDILVNNKDQIYVERRGRLELTSKKFISNDQVRAVIERIVAPLGRRIDESSPMVDARLPDGSRVNAIIPPLSIKGPVLSIRRFANIRYTQEDLIKFGSINEVMALFIRACVIARKNLIVAGGTGSGKTTLLNILSSYIPPTDRIITIEDAAELKLVQPHWVSLEARPQNVEGKGEITIRELFRNALRMRPDRIIIGECRGAETLDMLQAMNTGHEGSMTTVHANSPKDVIARLDSMVLMSSVELPIHAIREMVASAVHLIVHVSRMSDGSRRVVSITELLGLEEETEIKMREIFRFQQTGVDTDGAVLGSFTATGQFPTFLEELKVKGIIYDEAGFRPASLPRANGAPPAAA